MDRLGDYHTKSVSQTVFLPAELHGQRSLAGYSPWGCKEVDRTERLTLMTSSSLDYIYKELTSKLSHIHCRLRLQHILGEPQ